VEAVLLVVVARDIFTIWRNMPTVAYFAIVRRAIASFVCAAPSIDWVTRDIHLHCDLFKSIEVHAAEIGSLARGSLGASLSFIVIKKTGLVIAV
jgi:hypothetical protein